MMQDTISQSPLIWQDFPHIFFQLIVLFSASYETINTAAAAGTDLAVTFGENIAVLSLVSSIKRWRQWTGVTAFNQRGEGKKSEMQSIEDPEVLV